MTEFDTYKHKKNNYKMVSYYKRMCLNSYLQDFFTKSSFPIFEEEKHYGYQLK